MIQKHQEADQQVETPAVCRPAMVLLPPENQLPEQEVTHCLIQGHVQSHADKISSNYHSFQCHQQ